MQSSQVAVSKKENVLEILRQTKNTLIDQDSMISAFAVVRGGDDDSMGVWDDPEVVKALIDVDIPFFTALGHAHSVTLADKYAAQSFPTPGNFASSVNEEVEKYQQLQLLIHSKNKLTDELKNNDANLKNFEESNKNKAQEFSELSKKYKGLKVTFVLVCLMALVAAGFGFFLLGK